MSGNVSSRSITFGEVKRYLENNRTRGFMIPAWIRAVEDPSTAEALLTHSSFRGHKAFGCFLDGEMIGYAIIYLPRAHLEVMQISPKYRSSGYGRKFLEKLHIESVNVDRANTGALKLYESMGYEIEHDE